MKTDHPVLFIPGPVEVREEMRQIMAMPLIGHRSARFVEEVKAVCQKLKPLFLTKAHTLFENCPATALLEASIRNLVEKRVLHLTCGAFSERWYEISIACGREAEALKVEWGKPNLVEDVRKKLQSSKPFEAIAITHSETSTGLLNPVREIAKAVREVSPDTLVMVDVVTALAGAELRFDDWGLDIAFAGTQKCLALPPGLCVYAVSERAMQKSKRVPGRGFLFDFVAAEASLAKGNTLATPCVPLVFALSKQLDDIAAEGLEKRWQRHLTMRGMVEAWAREHDFQFFIDAPYRSPTVSTLRKSGRVVTDLIAKGKAAGFTMSNGYGKLKDETFRIGHMGDHTPEVLKELLAALS
jgi:aspartate aminotransferase-like enzyme